MLYISARTRYRRSSASLPGLLMLSVLTAYACGSDSDSARDSEVSGGQSGSGGERPEAGGGGVIRGGNTNEGGAKQGEGGAGAADAASGASFGGASSGGVGNAGSGNASGSGSGGEGASGGSAGDDAGGAAGSGSDLPVRVRAFERGSRLAARVHTGSDGSRHFIGWYDTLLGKDCEFRRLENGQYRCLPTTPTLITTSGIYVDAQCATPGARLSASCESVPDQVVVTTSPRPACDGMNASQILSIGEEQPMAYVGTACSPSSTEEYVVHATVADDPTLFVRAELVTVALGGDLGVQRFEASDGTRQVYSLVHQGQRCSPLDVESGGVRCVPQPALTGLGGYYADANCTRRAGLMHLGDGCEVPPYGVLPIRASGCSETARLVALSAVDETMLYSQGESSCVSINPPPLLPFRRAAIGDPVDPSVIPALDLVLRGERLRAQGVLTEQGSHIELSAQTLYDAELEESCQPRRFEDGTVRCIPNLSADVLHIFGDANCTQRIVPQVACNPAYWFERVLDEACLAELPIRQMFRMGAAHMGGTIYERLDDSTCASFTPEPSDSFLRLEPMSPGEFVLLTPEVD